LTLWAPAQAQLAGSHTLGDYGVQAGSQPGPGFYNVVFYYRYSSDTIKDVNGNTIRPLGLAAQHRRHGDNRLPLLRQQVGRSRARTYGALVALRG